MPRATDNRKAVGTEHCSECGTLARFYQVQRGNRTGYLYRRCECGADQKTGAALQARWLATMKRTDETMIPHPLNLAQPAPEPKPKPAPEETPNLSNEEVREVNDEPRQPGKKAGVFGVAALVGAVLIALAT